MARDASALLVGCWRFLEQDICYIYFVKRFKINRNIAIYLFFQLLNPQSDILNFVTPNALANSKAFSFYYDTIYWYFLDSLIDKPVVYCLIYFSIT